MIGIFCSKNVKELDLIVKSLEANMANNYKDNAQKNFADLSEKFLELKADGSINKKQAMRYENLIAEYDEKLKGFTHKDQKPYWV